mgnify:FL=1
MLIKQADLKRIQAGEVTLVFRRWKRPTVKPGGTLLTSVGQLAIHEVEPVELDELTDQDALGGGFARVSLLREALEKRSGQSYRIRLSYAGEDPRIALRNETPDAEAIRETLRSLERRDARSSGGPWTRRVLELIAAHPSTRAGDLAPLLGMEKPRFKTRVRGLKSLGLTISEGVGYRLSPRGEAVLEVVRSGNEPR